MIPHRSTPVPNIVFDSYLRMLKPTEVTLLLVIIRQTIGWVNKESGKRKYKDWISGYQLRQKSGYSRRAITSALARLINFDLVKVFDAGGWELKTPEQRKGKTRLYYAFNTPSTAIINEAIPTYAKTAQDLRKFCAQQKKFLQKKMTLSI